MFKVAAWKEGHKKKCKDLCWRWDTFQQSLKDADDAHNSADGGLSLCGIPLCAGIDYELLPTIAGMLNLVDGENRGLPTMRNFYNNLARVVNNEWWLFDNSDDSGYQYQKELDDGKSDWKIFWTHCGKMCFTEPDKKQQVDAMHRYGLDEVTVSMSPSRFLAIYKTNNTGVVDNKTIRFRTRKEKRCKALNSFVDLFHKNQCSNEEGGGFSVTIERRVGFIPNQRFFKKENLED